MFTPIALLYKIFEQHPVVCTDTRDIKKETLFFALKGANFNGNTFAEQAVKGGCAYAIVDEEQYVKGKQFLFVPDVLETLQALANYHRRMLNTPVIAITGSNGKTTTKELISLALSKKYNTLSTKGNLNNHIGVPLTLLTLTNTHEMAVIEMGANHIGEIAGLCAIAEPDYGIITNIGRAHLEGFGGPEGVIKAKSELYDYIKKKNGLLFVNADNDLLVKQAAGNRVLLYGTTNQVNVQGTLVKADPFVKMRWKRTETITPLIDRQLLNTHLAGRYNFENILAAACIASHFGVDEQKINEALEGYVPSNSRSQLIEKGTNKIILDAYNANPTSMKAAIENFSELNWPEKILILGEMLELGNETVGEHQAIIDLVKDKEFKKVYLVGKNFKKVNNTVSAQLFETADDLCVYFKEYPLKNASILVKGSRGVKLEKVVEVIN
ncbi:MAG: UDP-N-acetylmuramoyl-tripeptide--D-alanyl-D-alanine ligase [Bacteroidetes bacterium]|nr:UDP-N-acetylmuramoyl-tripeptide--D-alanyl-D-alanine ligase [Bacteroidota bacterium]